MKTTLSERGQISVPASLRTKLGLEAGQQFEWIDDGKVIHLIPVPENPIEHFQGSSGGLTRALLRARRREREKENGRRR